MAAQMETPQQAHKRALLARLARIEGQIRGIRRMIESDAGCEDVAQQLAASRKALNKAFYEMMACAIEHQLDANGALPAASKDKLGELTRLLAKYG